MFTFDPSYIMPCDLDHQLPSTTKDRMILERFWVRAGVDEVALLVMNVEM